jgi:hypothetical protein
MEAGRITLSAPLRLSIKMLPNASYFAFTATPKNKTLDLQRGVRSGRPDETPAVS